MNKKTKSIFSFGEILFDDYGKYKVLGGAPLNYIFHLNKFGYNGYLISKIGNDDDGSEIIAHLKKRSIPTNYISVDKKFPTGKVEVSINEEGIPTYSIKQNRAYDFIMEKADSNSCSLFYFGTLAQRSTTSRNTLYSYLSDCRPCFFDVNLRQQFYDKEVLTRSLNNAAVVKMNSEELSIISKLIYNQDSGDITQNAKKLLTDFRLHLLSITMGSEGALIITETDSSFHKENVENIVDTVGAGDAYSSILTLGYLKQWSIDRTNVFASKFAAAICGISGAIPEDDNFYNKYIDMINE